MVIIPASILTYHIRENLLARAAYAKTYGRPDFTNIIPNSTIDESDLDDETADPPLIRGRINISQYRLAPVDRRQL